jgi:GDP-mannose 6-dehydrogenase
VGSVTAACLARAGHRVVAVDVNPLKVDLINAGVPPVVEKGLGELLRRVVSAGQLLATTSGEAAVAASDMALICVGTPCLPNGRLDVEAVAKVGREIGAALIGRQRPFTVVLRSTVLPGTTEEVLLPSLRAGLGRSAGPPLRIAVNPEFMREGSSLEDFARPPLTLVGCKDAEAAELLRALYGEVDAPFVQTELRTAEMMKYVANAFHALKVCFANEIADVCDAMGADAQEVMQVFLKDRKLSVSEAYLRPGFAFGGSCLPKDVRALVYGARRADIMLPLLGAILPSNDAQVSRGVQAVLATGRRRIGVVGLAFKDGTDDLRESPLVLLAEQFIGKGLNLLVYDPEVHLSQLLGANRRFIEQHLPHIGSLIRSDIQDVIDNSEVLIVGLNDAKIIDTLARHVRKDQLVLDLVNIGDASAIAAKVEGLCW